ncbi:hypothetical protein EVAR_68706_1 [Eumeta japonica]|uniref:Uncharacterized protein n=1 Tax=Eumeta variegata TaxID=151549 RepID=A0A4C2A2Q9_EUMVA|nr:hypothetical protein EVAR_68706_1 [Eumeta japonica]
MRFATKSATKIGAYSETNERREQDRNQNREPDSDLPNTNVVIKKQLHEPHSRRTLVALKPRSLHTTAGAHAPALRRRLSLPERLCYFAGVITRPFKTPLRKRRP